MALVLPVPDGGTESIFGLPSECIATADGAGWVFWSRNEKRPHQGRNTNGTHCRRSIKGRQPTPDLTEKSGAEMPLPLPATGGHPESLVLKRSTSQLQIPRGEECYASSPPYPALPTT